MSCHIIKWKNKELPHINDVRYCLSPTKIIFLYMIIVYSFHEIININWLSNKMSSTVSILLLSGSHSHCLGITVLLTPLSFQSR